jgi:hypothetical protein
MILHEMGHVASKRPNAWAKHGGHGDSFFAELYRLPEWVMAHEWRGMIEISERDYFAGKPMTRENNVVVS